LAGFPRLRALAAFGSWPRPREGPRVVAGVGKTWGRLRTLVLHVSKAQPAPCCVIGMMRCVSGAGKPATVPALCGDERPEGTAPAEANTVTDTSLSTVYRRYIDCLNRQDLAELEQFVHDEVRHNGEPIGLSGYRDPIGRRHLDTDRGVGRNDGGRLAIYQRSPVFVGALVGERRKKLMNEVAVSAVDLERVRV
jgi:hypothetical protein